MKFVIRVWVISAALLLGACGNTWEGVKQDSSEMGKAIGEAAEDAGQAIKEATE